MPAMISFDRIDDNATFNLARIKKGGQHFEVILEPEKVVELKEGKSVEIRDTLRSENIFADAKKGLLAPEHLFKQAFGTEDTLKIAETIIRDGEVQLTAEYRKGLRGKKLKQIIEIIHRNGVDPRTHLPHPVARIEMAMEEAKIRIDEFKKPEEQVSRIVSELRVMLPIKLEVAEIEIIISNSQNAARAYPTVKSYSTILKDDWLNDGSWRGVVEIPAGLSEELFSKLNKITKGEIETKIIRTR
jgi:ribosome maturation protein SDO1